MIFFFNLAEYLVMMVWFKNLCVTTVQTARMKCTVFAYDKMAGKMQQNLDGCNRNQEFVAILNAMTIMFLRIL